MHCDFLSTNYPSGIDQISTQQTFNDDQWHHFVVVRGSGGVIKIYADGDNQTLVLNQGDGINNENVNNAISFAIGRKNSGGQSWDGLIDEVRIYSRALSSTEISEHYQGVFKDETGLVGHWTFDKVESNGTVLDKSGQGNTGTLKPTYPTNCPAFIE